MHAGQTECSCIEADCSHDQYKPPASRCLRGYAVFIPKMLYTSYIRSNWLFQLSYLSKRRCFLSEKDIERIFIVGIVYVSHLFSQGQRFHDGQTTCNLIAGKKVQYHVTSVVRIVRPRYYTINTQPALSCHLTAVNVINCSSSH